ncbi:ankyrin repeat domain-containing protein [Pseudomonas aeruginosa]|nr:ankyrin repeat domain-containing protein [Pseudomonas aeruginosa]MCV6440835.1 ankyrin repeat domain-containing protein [Pseudomonas aeruginosa]
MRFRRTLSFIVLVLQLLASGCSIARVQSPETYFSGEQLVLVKAIRQGDPAEVERLARALARDALNRPGAQDMTLLFFALQRAFGEKPQPLQVMTVLVRAGADPLQRVPNLGSVLGVSLRAKSPLYVKALLDAGVSPNTVEGDTPILFDAANEHTAETLKLLLDRGADIDKIDSLGNTALMEALTSMQLDQVSYLLDRGASPRFVNINGVSFAGQLQFQIGRQQPGSLAHREMLEIRDRIIGMGVTWPPASRDLERERMRSRGEVPGKLRAVQ